MPPPLIARSSGLLVCVIAPWSHIDWVAPSRMPPPSGCAASSPPRKSEKFARARLKPTVDVFAMLSPTTPMASPWASRPLTPM
jgi:hypothetical protein